MKLSKTAPEIDKDAAAWLWKRESGDWTPEAEQAFQAWISSHTAHQGAFIRAEALWLRLDEAQWHEPAVTLTDRFSIAPLIKDRRFVLGGAGALAASLATLFFMPKGETLHTTIGEVKTVPLKDGSYLSLNTDSRVHVDYDNHFRRLKLETGESWFKVEHNSARPFVVEVGRVRVQAVGTAFAIKRLENSTEITVTEGVVEVWVEDVQNSKRRISAGNIAYVSQATTAVAFEKPIANIDRRLAWRQGKINLDGETLSEAISEFNRYNQTKLILDDHRLSQEQLYGIFDSRDPQSFATSVGVSMKITIRQDKDEIHIGSKSNLKTS